MSVSFVQGTYQQSVGNDVLAYSSPNTAGNLLIAFNRLFGSSLTMNVPTDSQGNTWVQVDNVITNANNQFAMFYAKNCKAGANTVTTGGTGSAGFGNELIIMEYSGADLSAPLGQHAPGNGTGVTGSAGPVTTPANAALVAAFGNGTAILGATTPGSGYTNRVVSAGTLVSEDKVVSSITTSTATEGFGAGSVVWAGVAAVFVGPVTATPAITPVNGAYSSPQTVSISCATPSSSIFYTTDGSTPTTGSTPYTGPFSVSIPATVKAIASAAGFDNSLVATNSLSLKTFSLIQKTAYASQALGAPSQTFGSPTTAGNLLIALVYSTSSPAVLVGPASGNPTSTGTSITDTAGNVWKQAGVYAVSGITGIWYCESCLGGTPTVTWNLGTTDTTNALFKIALAEYSGQLVSHPLSFAGGIAGSVGHNQPISGAYCPVPGCLIISEWGSNGVNSNWSGGVNCTIQSAVTNVNVIWADTTATVVGNNQVTATGDPDNIGAMAVFLPSNYVPPNGYSLVRTTMGTDNQATTAAPRFAGGNQANNLILVAVVTTNSSSSDIASITDTAGNTYSLIASFHGANQLNDFISIYAVQSCIGTKVDNTITITTSVAPSIAVRAFACEFSGQLRVGTLLDTSTTVFNSGNLGTNISPAAAGELLFQVGTRGAGPTVFFGLGPNQTDLSYFALQYSGYKITNQGLGTFGDNTGLYTDFAVSSAGVNALALSTGVGTSALTVALNAAPAASTPIFSPVAGTYPNAQVITISTSSAGATIFYTTDGSTPTHLSNIYTVPFSVAATATVKAIAGNGGFSDSPVGVATYTITPSVYSVPDCRKAPVGPNASRNVQDTLTYDVQTSSNSSVPGKDSRVSPNIPIDSRVSPNIPKNSRTPGVYGPGVN